MKKQNELMKLSNKEGVIAQCKYANGNFFADCSDGKLYSGFKSVMELIDSMRSRGFEAV